MTHEFDGKLVAEKYRIESLIGESDSGDLFSGRHEILDKPVTVKILPQALSIDARWARRFIDESRSASALSHPNILNLTDFGSDARGVTYAVYEPIEGVQLSEVVTGALDEKRSIEIARQIAAAASAAHAKKLVHGHLNPQNAFIDIDESGVDHVKVYGFGGDPMSVERDADPRYLAPEQCNAFPVADHRSDIYALAVILYEMLSGVLPFEGTTVAEIQTKLTTEPPPPLSAFRKDLNPEIEPVILTAMSAIPERRYQAMAAFAEDLELLSNRIAPARVAAAGTSKRNIWKTATIAFAGIAILAAGLIYFTSARKTDPTTQLQADAGSFPVQPIGPATGAQEESLARLPAMTDAEIMATTAEPLPGTFPGGDGYNAWSNGVVPPIGAPPLGVVVPQAGAPLNQTAPPLGPVQPGGQVVTINPNGGSQFMPQDGGVILVPVPKTPEPTPTPKPPAANTQVQPSPTPAKTFVKPGDVKPAGDTKAKPATPGKTNKKPDDDLQLKQ